MHPRKLITEILLSVIIVILLPEYTLSQLKKLDKKYYCLGVKGGTNRVSLENEIGETDDDWSYQFSVSGEMMLVPNRSHVYGIEIETFFKLSLN